jgi:zona occludens toxin
MLYITTGANGTGKTLFTLKAVREHQLKENRPVFHNGRFTLTAEGESFGWKKIDFKDWQDCPDGAIFLIDECHNDMPKIASGAAVPPHIQALGEHRRRGFDFYLITQHPQNISTFVRKLVGAPGWHRHLKRNFGADLVSQLEWSFVNDACEKPGAGKNGTVTMRAFPKEVYPWYSSAVLHTGKKRIPRQVVVFAACVLVVPILGFLAYRSLTNSPAVMKTAAPVVAPGAPSVRPGSRGLSRDEWLAQTVPRIEGLPATAPKYDKVTEATDAPYPAACIESKRDGCKCYTQQATLMTVPIDLCRMIVHRGYFMDWQSPSVAASLKHETDMHARRDSAASHELATKIQPPAPVPALPGGATSQPSASSAQAIEKLVAPPLVVADAAPDPNAARDTEVWQFIKRRQR